MAYQLVQSRNTQFAIDWDVVRQLVHSSWVATLQYNKAKEVKISDSHWYNPASWDLPDVSHLEVDWDAVKSEADTQTDLDMSRFRSRAAVDAAGVASELSEYMDNAASLRQLFLDWMGNLQTQNMEQIDKAVKDYDADIEVAKFMRDTSADGLMVGASVLTGGAATACLAGGSILKGAFTFQDSGSIGAASMEAVGSFVFASVKVGDKFKQQMVLTIVQAGWKTGTELVAGATVSDAVASGALKLTGPAVDRIFTTGPAKTIFDLVPVPIWVNVRNLPGDKMYVDKSAEFFGGLTKTLAGNKIESAGKKMFAEPSGQTSSVNGQSGPVVRQATLTNKLLLYLAFVNMNKGIGRGW